MSGSPRHVVTVDDAAAVHPGDVVTYTYDNDITGTSEVTATVASRYEYEDHSVHLWFTDGTSHIFGAQRNLF
jgi:hypothetical protein